MDDQIEEITYHSVSVPGGAGEAARVLNSISNAGVGLIAFAGSPHDDGGYRLVLVPGDSAQLASELSILGLDPGPAKAIFLDRAEGRPGRFANLLHRLAAANIDTVTVLGDSLIAVDPVDVEKAAEVLDVAGSHPGLSADIVDQTSEESFPASDPPSWTAGAAS